ncbi:hypothetical protein BUALT_Bualt04G0142700 [Buddleja alternifolia]|uniref:SPX domain-containing protein n=1 Tax=Buddleja alternifolia TaxID=168488 RepID=A0AAV6Y055_9LAMI|nr:hypothetical protein BUALT_Bualt04G0142700 [Buddleja alternifolia]
MKFGKEFMIHLEKTLPNWRDKFLRYKPLKKLIKNIPAVVADNLPPVGDAAAAAAPPQPLSELQVWFVWILIAELEKFNDFYVEKEEEFIIRFQLLLSRALKVINDGMFTSETEFSEEMMQIRKDFVSIHGEMVLLKSYSSLNFAGLIKILKKYDKRTGSFMSLPFTQFAFHQPFFTTDPLTNLVRECEENLEILFPMEAEVVESNGEQTGTTPTDMSNALLGTNVTLGEETIDIYRSTIAAISAIQRLKRASSTYNPLSMAFLFGRQDNENTGAVTAENSPCNSVMSSDDEDDEMDMSDDDENEDV